MIISRLRENPASGQIDERREAGCDVLIERQVDIPDVTPG